MYGNDSMSYISNNLLQVSIPKRMFFIWEGHSLSYLRYLTIYSFKKLNPDWDIHFYYGRLLEKKSIPWTESAIQDFSSYSGKDYFYELSKLNIEMHTIESQFPKFPSVSLSPVHKSDILRWHLLSKYGGFYADTDILFIKSLEEVYKKAKEVQLLTCFFDEYFSIGFLGSCSGNRFYSNLLELCKKVVNVKQYESVGIPAIHRLLSGDCSAKKDILKYLKKKYPEYRILHCSKNLVYPLVKEEIFQKLIVRISSETVGLHWFAGYPFVQKYNNSITCEQELDKNTTFGHFALRVLHE